MYTKEIEEIIRKCRESESMDPVYKKYRELEESMIKSDGISRWDVARNRIERYLEHYVKDSSNPVFEDDLKLLLHSLRFITEDNQNNNLILETTEKISVFEEYPDFLIILRAALDEVYGSDKKLSLVTIEPESDEDEEEW